MEKINKLSLNDVEWKEFVIGKIFNISGTLTTHPSALINGGQTPRITCAATNNGFENTYQNQPTEKGQVLTVDSATIGFVSYQAVDFIATDHVEKISMKNGNTMNRYIGLFLVNAITYSTANKYGYGYKFSQSRIAKQKILLPVTIEGTPDYAFMEEYMRLKETELLEKYRQYISSKIKDLNNEVDKNVEWKEFLFPEIFKIKKGFYNKKPESSNEGKIPFLGATANNNGITEFYTISEIKNNSKTGREPNHPLNKKIFPGNCIAVTNNGSVGYAYYQTTDFTCSHDINPLYLRNQELNREIAFFLITAIEKQRICFEYARKWRPMRMVKSKILLPVNKKGNPDYEYMENYIKQIEQRKLRDYLEYKGLV